METLLHVLRRELLRWVESLSFREIKENRRLVDSIERIDELFEKYEIDLRN